MRIGVLEKKSMSMIFSSHLTREPTATKKCLRAKIELDREATMRIGALEKKFDVDDFFPREPFYPQAREPSDTRT